MKTSSDTVIDKRQLIKVQTYRRLAQLSEIEYRNMLKQHANVTSSKDMRQSGFDSFMPAIEVVLWYRVNEGFVPDPRETSRHKHLNPYYWRSRKPKRGACNSRLRHKVDELFTLLMDYLPPEKRDQEYLAAIIAHASGIRISQLYSRGQVQWQHVPARAAHLTIEGIKDRLHYAMRGAK